MKEKFAIILAVISLQSSALADNGIVIPGSRTETPSTVDIITVSDSDRQVKTLSGLLESRAGVQVTRYGTSGSYSSIYIRGTNSNQLAVYIDGIPVSDSVSGETNFENIPLDSLDRIEVYKSFTPLYFASPGIGGVINLVTRKDRRTAESGISASAGSFGYYRLWLFSSFAGEDSELLASGSASMSKGDFPFVNNNGTMFNSDDDFTDRRKNNRFKSANGSLRYSYGSGDFKIDAVSDLFAKDQGVAAYNNTASSASLSTIRNRNYARCTVSEIAGLPLHEEVSIFTDLRRDVFDDMNSEIGFFEKKSTGLYLSYGAGSYTSLNAEKLFQELSLSLQVQNESYYLSEETSGDSRKFPPMKRSALAAGVQDNFSFFNGRVSVVPQIRLDIRKDSFPGSGSPSESVTAVNPQAGAMLWVLEDLFYIKGSFARNHRAPSFSELFGDSGTVQGNPGLRDETSVSHDFTAGLTYADFSSDIIQAFSVEYSYFMTGMKNIIIFMQNSQYTMKADNISAASVTGHEFTARMTLLDCIDLSCNGTVQYAKDKSDIPYYSGNYLPHRPVIEGRAGVKLFSREGSVAYQYSYTGGNYRDRANSESLYVKHRNFHTVSAVWNIRFDLTFTFEAKNVSDNMTQDVAGYPLPGRSFTGSVQYIF